jgi:hypothetical protein
MTASPSIHSVHIYEDSAALISRLCAIVSSSLRSGDTVLIIATAEHREQLLTDLQDCGLDVRLHAREGRYMMLDAHQTLATFMRDGLPNNKLFTTAVCDILDHAHDSALANGKCLTVFGEMVAVFGRMEGKRPPFNWRFCGTTRCTAAPSTCTAHIPRASSLEATWLRSRVSIRMLSSSDGFARTEKERCGAQKSPPCTGGNDSTGSAHSGSSLATLLTRPLTG